MTILNSVDERLKWLKRNSEAYRAAGLPDCARRVLIEKQKVRTTAHDKRAIRVARKAWVWFLNATVGFGYRNLRILWWLAGTLMVGTLLFQRPYDSRYLSAKQQTQAPVFNALLYALDLLLPIASLGQRGNFVPQGPAVGFTSEDGVAVPGPGTGLLW
jgi:hypothetical protein